jgi:aminopeptidase-like protein
LEESILWVLNQSDGTHSLLDIAERSKLSFDVVSEAAEALQKSGLLQEAK